MVEPDLIAILFAAVRRPAADDSASSIFLPTVTILVDALHRQSTWYGTNKWLAAWQTMLREINTVPTQRDTNVTLISLSETLFCRTQATLIGFLDGSQSRRTVGSKDHFSAFG